MNVKGIISYYVVNDGVYHSNQIVNFKDAFAKQLVDEKIAVKVIPNKVITINKENPKSDAKVTNFSWNDNAFSVTSSEKGTWGGVTYQQQLEVGGYVYSFECDGGYIKISDEKENLIIQGASPLEFALSKPTKVKITYYASQASEGVVTKVYNNCSLKGAFIDGKGKLL